MNEKQTPVKSQLFKLKEWLTVPDAARHLSIVFGEEVNEADVLRLALDKHLKLSVNLVHKVCAKRGEVVPLEGAIWDALSQSPAVEKSNRENSLKDIKHFNEAKEKALNEMEDKIQKYIEKDPEKFMLMDKIKKIKEDGREAIIYIKSLNIDYERFINLEDGLILIDGVWDLSMIGNERFDIEHEYQMLTGGPEVKLSILDGTFVQREDGQICQILERSPNIDRLYNDDSYKDFQQMAIAAGTTTKELLAEMKKERENRPYYHPNNYYPAGKLPSDSVLVVRTQALINFQDRLSTKEFTNNTTIGTHVEIPFFDKDHSFYAHELKIAVETWTELYEKNPPKSTPIGGHKTYIEDWLNKMHPNLSKRAIERITTVINPNPKGGATPTGNG